MRQQKRHFVRVLDHRFLRILMIRSILNILVSIRGVSQPTVCHTSNRGARHEIGLVPGTKYCVTRQWPLPKEQCDVIDDYICAKHADVMVRGSNSPHSTPTFCVR